MYSSVVEMRQWIVGFGCDYGDNSECYETNGGGALLRLKGKLNDSLNSGWQKELYVIYINPHLNGGRGARLRLSESTSRKTLAKSRRLDVCMS